MPKAAQAMDSAEEHMGVMPPKLHNPKVLLHTVASEAWTEKHFADVTIDVKGAQFQLHRLVVCESPLFRSLFLGEWKEHQKVYTLAVEDDLVTAASFEAVVATMYGRDMGLNMDNAKGFYAAASFLQMSAVAMRCAEFVAAHLTLTNVADILHLAATRGYLASDVLLEACATYYKQYAFELRRQLLRVPLGVLRDILKSDALAVPTEILRFRLVTDVFGAKMEAAWANLGPSSDEDNGHIELRFEGKEDEFQDCAQTACTNRPPEGDSETSGALPALNSGRSELVELREAFVDVLENGILYEHLRDREVMEVSNRLDDLGIEEGLQAFWHGMLKARLLKMAIQDMHNAEMSCSASSLCQAKGMPPFRFSCELEDVMNVGLFGRWESDKCFYAGSNWWMKVEGGKDKQGSQGLGVRLCCASAVKCDCEYVNKLIPHVQVTIRCGEVRKVIDKDGSRWLAPTDFFLRTSRLKLCLTETGSLRFVVLIKLNLNARWL
ncbi:unnamed protein product [Ostreobium quekettii]|uniref:BTB domain-containing protein n=1 Tax=Ostreobium quekettii TaxID=121088 RepID=A0A8S1IZL3_9CHLO|nr:unnamed protein product [Ostreobium quekettii]